MGCGAGHGVGGVVEGGCLGRRRRAGLRQRWSLHLRRGRRRFGGEGKGRRLSAWGVGGQRSWRGSGGVEGGLEAAASRRLDVRGEAGGVGLGGGDGGGRGGLGRGGGVGGQLVRGVLVVHRDVRRQLGSSCGGWGRHLRRCRNLRWLRRQGPLVPLRLQLLRRRRGSPNGSGLRWWRRSGLRWWRRSRGGHPWMGCLLLLGHGRLRVGRRLACPLGRAVGAAALLRVVHAVPLLLP